MIKIAMIGAGSVMFSRNLTGDILSYPEFRNAHFAYHDIDQDRLNVGAALCRKVATALDATPNIKATLDLDDTLKGADFVINMVQIGGFNSTLVDFEIPRKYGLNFTIADTTGPGGLLRALRTYPMLRDLCQRMMKHCPKAVLLNYSNPMCMNMHTVFRTSDIMAVGLCHSVQGTLDQLMRYIGENPADVNFSCAGINHMAFYTRLEKDGVDLYPRLFDAMNKPEIYKTNKVRFELMRRLGYFVTESSEHSAEYSAYFIPHGKDQIAKFDVPIDEYLRRCDLIVDEFARMKEFAASAEPMHFRKSPEYGSTIIHSLVTGKPSVIYGNAPNKGSVPNLPPDCITEVATVVDRSGMRRTAVEPLPPQLVGYMYPHITQQELFIRAAMEGRRDHIYQAAMADPLTAATLTLDQIVEMCDELIGAQIELLPKLDCKKTLVPGSGRTFCAVDPTALRASWDAAQLQAAEDFVQTWQIIGPFFGTDRKKISLDLPTVLEAEYIKNKIVDPTKSIGGMNWKPAKADRKTGFVNLARDLTAAEFCVAFAYAEINSESDRTILLRCGSDDGIRIYLNGKIIHNHETGRGYKPYSDQVTTTLKAGVNTLLVKCDNYHGTWGFGVHVPR